MSAEQILLFAVSALFSIAWWQQRTALLRLFSKSDKHAEEITALREHKVRQEGLNASISDIKSIKEKITAIEKSIHAITINMNIQLEE